MKICPKCNQTYTDENLNFCLNDGEVLNQYDDAPPTIMMDAPRITNQTSWQQSQYQPPSQPPAPWQNQSSNLSNQPYGQNQSFGMMQQTYTSQDQTLPIIALVLGIAAVMFICCHGGIWLGVPAIVVGYFGMKNADSDPARYGGRGMALAGMIMGVIMLLISIGFLFLGVLGSIFG